MSQAHFKGFPARLFEFFAALAENNNREWFDAHRREYETEVLGTVKAFVRDLGPLFRMLNDEFETEPRVTRTISRINNDLRFHKTRPPYRPFLYVGFPRFGQKWSTEALLYVGLDRHGASVGFYPGGYKKTRTGAIQEGIKKNLRWFQRYLDERRIAETYWELPAGEDGGLQKWPLPGTARRWVNMDNFIIGESFPAGDPTVARRRFLDRAQQIMLDLYPLWLLATSENLKADLELYEENRPALARPLTKSAPE